VVNAVDRVDPLAVTTNSVPTTLSWRPSAN
jgi:hypothetical protein